MTARRRRIRDHLGWRLPAPGDDTGSLAMALMAILVAAMLGGLMLPMVISQTKSTRFDNTRVHALHAAQTGIDVVLGEIRASTTTDTDGNVLGNPGALPCYTKGKDTPLTGTANGTGDGSYTVTVDYWATNPSAGGSPMVCSAGYGTYDPTTSTATPRYAVITSTGTDGTVESGSRGRVLVSTYVFQTDDTNISGGQFRIYPPGGTSTQSWCMDAGSAVPAQSAPIKLAACSVSTPPLAQQVFSYRSDLSIQLVSSVTKANPNGLCIDTSALPHSANPNMVLKTCGVVNPAKCDDVTKCSPYNQQWSVNDSAHLEGAASDKSNTDGFCMDVASQADGTPLTLQGCSGGTDSTRQTWVPTPTAGAGMAGAVNKQLVNYRQFATCLDVTDQNPSSAFLILYTCKQNPNPDRVTWNQKFTPAPALTAAPTRTLLKTTKDSVAYCLTSPLSQGGYVRVTSPCPAGVTAGSAMAWTVNQTQDAGKNDLPYAQKYTIVDANGLCLGLGANSGSPPDIYLKAVVATCDGSTGQKWNANTSLDSARLTNTHENQLPN